MAKKKTLIIVLTAVVVIGAAAALTIIMANKGKGIENEGFIGRSAIEVQDGRMTPEVLLSYGRLSDPQMSPDGKFIMYGVSYTDAAANRSVRNLRIISAEGGEDVLLTESGRSIGNARWSADGKRIAFTMGGQIWTARISRRDPKKGESSGSWKLSGFKQISDVPNGISEFKISPDGQKIMYVSTVKSAVKSPVDCYADLGKATAYTTDDLMYRHWDHTVMEIPHTFVADFKFNAKKEKTITPETSVDILAGEKELYELPTEPFGGIEQLDWSPDSRFIAYSCRKLTGKKYAFSTDTEIYLYNIATAGTTVIDMKGGYDTDPVWSPDGRKICWISMERDGYEADKQRLMVADVNIVGDVPVVSGIRDLTAGFKYNAAGPVWADDSRSIYFNALAEGLQGIFEAGCESGTVSRLTDEHQWYDYSSPFFVRDNGDGSKVLYSTYCSMTFPSEIAATTVRNGAFAGTVRTSDENGHISSQLKKVGMEERYVKTIDGKRMLTWVMLPPDFDSSKEYPSILICLGGPQGTISQSWSYRWNYMLMAMQDYVVVLPNRRGTTAFGQEWTEQISGDYPGLNMQDYLAAARELKAEPYIGKMAACGASYGGYSVYYLCGTHGDVFDAFIAHAGIFNEEHMYMTTEEMWFPNFDNGGVHETVIDPRVGTPEAPVGPAGDGVTFGGIKQGGSPWSKLPKAVRHYALSPHKLVTNWHTPLMVIHGGMDYRVPVDEGMAAYNAAQMMGVPSRLLIFPDENHWILKPQNALLWHREYFRWLDQWCK
ncbi:MAG: prolyl oligopeptidase family serine peptidase [Candidatus Cryptobacteroides sp.]